MEWSVEKGPAYSVLKVRLSPGESVRAEPGAMMLMRGPLRVETKSGGILKGLLRSLAGGESFFMNTYRAEGPAEVWFVPPVPGDIEAIELRGDEWVVQDTSYLAHHGDIDVSVKWRGLKGLFAEGELVWLSVKGTGTVWVNAYGAIDKVDVPAGERLIVDNLHLVAMPASARYRITKAGGLKTFIFGGEGLVVEIEGPTRVLVQTRVLPPFAQLLARFLPSRS
ncbi:MAG: TIGR00266 family protein [Desulfurococcales archaeon]|nr:TIGR00266 family protein [Desulfurococcales archaeon]